MLHVVREEGERSEGREGERGGQRRVWSEWTRMNSRVPPLASLDRRCFAETEMERASTRADDAAMATNGDSLAVPGRSPR